MSNVTSLSEAVRRRDWKKERFTWAHTVAAHDSLSDAAKLLAYQLVSKHWDADLQRCAPGMVTMCAAMKASERKVRRALSELEELGFVRRGLGGHRGASVEILFRDGPAARPEVGHEKAARSDRLSVKKAAKTDRLSGGERRPDLVGKAASFGNPPTPPYKDLQDSPKGRAPDAKPASVADQCPANRLEEVHPGSVQHQTWDAWLSSRGYPLLAQIGRRRAGAENGPWLMCSRSPPDPSRPVAVSAAVKFVEWLIATSTNPSAERTADG